MSTNSTSQLKKTFVYSFLFLSLSQSLWGVKVTNLATHYDHGSTLTCVVDRGWHQIVGKTVPSKADFEWKADPKTCKSNDNNSHEYCSLLCAYEGHNWTASLHITPENMDYSYNIVNGEKYPDLILQRVE